MMENYDVIIIGAGAAGLMCAIESGKRGRKVLILDKASKAGNKIYISGGGRCNFTNTNTSPDDFLSNNPHFCKSALSRYTPWHFIALLESHGLSGEEKTLGQLFCKQKAAAIVEMLIQECELANVEIRLNCEIKSITKETRFNISTATGYSNSDSLVVATGGPSIPRMGSTDFALQIARQFGIKNIPFSPALVPFTFHAKTLENFIKELSGISCLVRLSTKTRTRSNRETVSFKEAILFTHRGISGPAALQISSYWKKDSPVSINFFPDFNVYEWLKEQQQKHPLAELKTILAYKLPKRLATKLCENLNPSPSQTKVTPGTMKQINSQELETLAEQLTHWEFSPASTEGMRTAEVSLGGIDTNELSSKTFAAKKVTDLFFIGECIDVTGHLGGFNLQWAWASGWCAGQYA